MSRFDYEVSLAIARGQLSEDDPPFYGIIMAAMRKADTNNLARLATAFPDTYEELKQRRDANHGVLAGEYCPHCNEKAVNNKHVCRPESARLYDELMRTAEEGAEADGTGTHLCHPEHGWLAAHPKLWVQDPPMAFIFANRQHAEEFMEGWTLLEGAEVRQRAPEKAEARDA